MTDLVPGFGIDEYLTQLATLADAAPSSYVVFEGALFLGLGLVGLLLLAVALLRRSAVAAVSFSFVALTALVAAIITGQLDFVPPATQTLVVCLHGCALLLFLTATVRIARDNALVGVIILVLIASLLLIGGGVALGFVPGGWTLARLGMAVAIGLSLLLLSFEIIRGDRPTLVVAPGLLMVLGAAPAMIGVARLDGLQSLALTLSPLALLAFGTVAAVFAAQFVAGKAAAPAPVAVRRTAGVGAMVGATAMLREYTDDDDADGRHAPHRQHDQDHHHDGADLAHGHDAGRYRGFAGSDEELAPDTSFGGPRLQRDLPVARREGAGRYDTAHLHEGATEPVSARWGTDQNKATPDALTVAPDEYIWDMMADREVRMGAAFAGLFDLAGSRIATPDVLRDAVANESLAEFDDEVLGGAHPATGRFHLDLRTTSGRRVHLVGRRQADHDGLLLRIEAQAEGLAAAAHVPPARPSLLDAAGAAGGTGPALAATRPGRGQKKASSPPPAAMVDDSAEAPFVAEPRDLGRKGAKAKAKADARPARGGKAVDKKQQAAIAATASAAAAAPVMMRRHPGAGAASAAVDALDAGAIEAHFQPIVRLADRHTVGFEALARWRRADGDLVDAGSFIDDIVAAGRGLDLARLVIDQAAAELAGWIEAEPGQGQFVSVNIAAADLPRAGLAEIIGDAVGRHKLPAGALVIELTEGRIQASQAQALAAARAVRAAGASLAIDDFGAGYSNLARLSKFRFDLIKTDRSMLEGIASDRRRRTAIKSLIATAAKAQAPVIAEGIEDEETAGILAELGCDFGQGFLFGRPEPIGGAAAAEPEPEPPISPYGAPRYGESDVAGRQGRGRGDLR